MSEHAESFDDFIHPFVHEVIGKNEANEERYGKHSHWDWDYDSSLLTFSDPENSTLQIKVSVVGTTEGDSWQWSWSNQNFELHTKLDMEKVREFGEAIGHSQLTSAFLDA